VVSGSESVYVGGRFDQAGDVTTNNLALWSGSSWSALSGGAGHEWAYVYDMAIRDSDHDTLYIGGDFASAGSEPSYHFARRYFVPIFP
jgi:hypothetical protein